ncbi:hypothetical protein PLICRDRAFT_43400 [Plicaturopsis crispa FD-325 SS-3]|nr:hypothetical protein PLICRDRAFT_43400 [Plicaturopsis crispa FD-325 SS-3]
MNKLPPEMILEIFPWLPLKGLVAAMGVNRHWRHLVPLADLYPARRSLLDLYTRTISSSRFLETRPLLLAHLSDPFDRERYIATLDAYIEDFVAKLEDDQHRPVLPEDFRLWLLEWPARSVIGRIWPGLQHGSFSETIGPRGYNGLANCFAHLPKVGFIDCEDATHARSGVKAAEKPLAIEVWWHSKTWSSWLVVDESQPELKGKVYSVVPAWAYVHGRVEAESWTDWLERQLDDDGAS